MGGFVCEDVLLLTTHGSAKGGDGCQSRSAATAVFLIFSFACLGPCNVLT